MTTEAPLHPGIRNNAAALVGTCPVCDHELVFGPSMSARDICPHVVLGTSKPKPRAIIQAQSAAGR